RLHVIDSDILCHLCQLLHIDITSAVLGPRNAGKQASYREQEYRSIEGQEVWPRGTVCPVGLH
ncbi:MAG: hypothetical protein RJQ10_09770, partial [Haliea sp.]|uniref:hypothetical protein n=1 Tax=Haliea sp. TaxID=1932666 RepID=UPI0032EBA492